MVELVLGTAQWGSDYGVTNTRGRIRDVDLDELVYEARRAGITQIDTAANYGDAQRRLRPWAREFRITTKVPGADPDSIAASVDASLAELAVSSVDAVLLHDWDALPIEIRQRAATALEDVRASGRCVNVGVSAYDVAGLRAASDSFARLDVAQLPVNALDQRLVRDPLVTSLRETGVRFQARSVFLQGLLAGPSATPLGRHPDIRRFHDHAQQAGESPLDLAIAFARSLEWVSDVVVGVTDSEELKEILRSWDAPSTRRDLASLASSDLDLIDPRRWRPLSTL
jgi:aryl-alcohol dehydrogenase-like predicted oxidoreductase